MEGLRYAEIDDPDRFTTIRVMYPPPKNGNVWGDLLPLKGTSWGKEIPIVSGEALSHAFHGDPIPLRKMLGPPPLRRVLRIPWLEKLCLEHQQNMCDLATRDCHPGTNLMPDCYVAPTQDRALRKCATAVALAWSSGRYVFLVSGPEFVIT